MKIMTYSDSPTATRLKLLLIATTPQAGLLTGCGRRTWVSAPLGFKKCFSSSGSGEDVRMMLPVDPTSCSLRVIDVRADDGVGCPGIGQKHTPSQSSCPSCASLD